MPEIISKFEHNISFFYNNERRVLKQAVLRRTLDGNKQIAGVQIRKGDEVTDEVRVFSVDKVQGEVTELAGAQTSTVSEVLEWHKRRTGEDMSKRQAKAELKGRRKSTQNRRRKTHGRR